MEESLNSTQEEVWEREDRAVGRQWPSGVDVDTATVVSIGSSCVILLSGAIAVVCLILYMKKTESIRLQMQTNHVITVCAKCGAQVSRGQSFSAPSDQRVVQTRPQTPQQTPMVEESALYAISGADLIPKSEDSFIGFICGHISADSQTTYSADANINAFIQHPGQTSSSSVIQEPKAGRASQCSSNEELLRLHTKRLSFESFYESIVGSEERETPTDPGIRQFTETPPKPNERRQGVVQHNNTDGSSASSSVETTPTNESSFDFGALRRSRAPTWKLWSDSETIKCLSSLTQINGLSASECETSDDDVQRRQHTDDSRRQADDTKCQTIDC